jgi:hypothetical protein
MRLALILSMALGNIPAFADIPPRDTHGCVDKKVGDACLNDEKQDGRCANTRCVGRDYSQGMPPRQKEYDCLRCGTADKLEAAGIDAGPVVVPAPATPAPAPKKSGCSSAPSEFVVLGLLVLAVRRRA